eukprot:Pompholyxophrys_punicea_v1_NODE_3_length_10569_cov_612.508655.p7 type:complete len:126 gc:universal NODE_3_length_10569_cov_612.508655:3350-3727(+)
MHGSELRAKGVGGVWSVICLKLPHGMDDSGGRKVVGGDKDDVTRESVDNQQVDLGIRGRREAGPGRVGIVDQVHEEDLARSGGVCDLTVPARSSPDRCQLTADAKRILLHAGNGIIPKMIVAGGK